MQPVFEVPESITAELQSLHQIGQQIQEKIVSLHTPDKISMSDDLFVTRQDQVILITEGLVSYVANDRELFHFEQGDIIGVEAYGSSSRGVYRLPFAIRGVALSRDAFYQVIRESGSLAVWQEYTERYTAALLLLIGESAKGETPFTPCIKSYGPGETIIHEGRIEPELYTLIKGHAEVYVGDVRVGEVLEDEIFGGLGALTNTARTASVRATCDCMVTMIHKNEFLDLVSRRPAMVTKMVEDLARAVVALNNELVKKEKGSYVTNLS
jgi:signal-transduction protein with cAMP-binding, CBS, and nucleotidyltransferase domain